MSDIKEILAAQVSEITASYGADAHTFEEVFNFRTAAKCPDGADWPAVTEPRIDEETGEAVQAVKGYKRASIKTTLFRPTAAVIAGYFAEACPEQETILSLVEDYIFGEAQKILSENPGMTAADFPLDRIAFSVLARLPKEVKSRGLDKDELQAFCKDYVEVMPEITGYSADRCAIAANVFEKRLSPVRTDEVSQRKLREYLDVYIAKAPNAANFGDVLDFLTKRLDELLNSTQVSLADAL